MCLRATESLHPIWFRQVRRSALFSRVLLCSPARGSQQNALAPPGLTPRGATRITGKTRRIDTLRPGRDISTRADVFGRDRLCFATGPGRFAGCGPAPVCHARRDRRDGPGPHLAGRSHLVGSRSALPAVGPRHQRPGSSTRRRWSCLGEPCRGVEDYSVADDSSYWMSVLGKPRMKSLPKACEAVEKPLGTSPASAFCKEATAVTAVNS